MNFSAGEFLADAADLVEQYRAQVADDLIALPGDKIWERPVPGQVSAANLVLHLTGNLRHFFGHHLAETSYVRKRDREFEEAERPSLAELLERWDEACVETKTVFRTLDPVRLTQPAPVDGYPGGVPVHGYILRLLGHLTYHAGQIRMLRRLLAPAVD